MDWAIIFSISFIVAVLLIVVGVYTYIDLNVQFKASEQSGKTSVGSIIDTKLLSKILGQFSDRADLRTNLLHGYSGPPDPSI